MHSAVHTVTEATTLLPPSPCRGATPAAAHRDHMLSHEDSPRDRIRAHDKRTSLRLAPAPDATATVVLNRRCGWYAPDGSTPHRATLCLALTLTRSHEAIRSTLQRSTTLLSTRSAITRAAQLPATPVKSPATDAAAATQEVWRLSIAHDLRAHDLRTERVHESSEGTSGGQRIRPVPRGPVWHGPDRPATGAGLAADGHRCCDRGVGLRPPLKNVRRAEATRRSALREAPHRPW